MEGQTQDAALPYRLRRAESVMPGDHLCWLCGVSSGLQRGRENSLGLSLLVGAYWEDFKEEAFLLGLEG